MSCFRLPAPVCKRMKTYISNYWWGSAVDSHKIHWQRWSKLTTPKGEGGMGFRDLPLFNKAMLGKQGWRLITRPDSLCARVIKGKYFPNGEFLTANRKKRSFETWRAMLHGREALVKGIIKRVGPGSSINIWNDNWIPGLRSLKPTTRLEGASVHFVNELFLPGTRVWNVDLVQDSFISRDAEEILKIRPGARMEDDGLGWAHERSGQYSVRSSYQLLKMEQSERETDVANEPSSSCEAFWWRKLWKLKIPPKIRIFWWRSIQNYLPSKQELKRRHVTEEDFCEVCGMQGESIYHICFDCTIAKRFW